MAPLRKRLIRLAYSNPDLRLHLLPILKESEDQRRTLTKRAAPLSISLVSIPEDVKSAIKSFRDNANVEGWDHIREVFTSFNKFFFLESRRNPSLRLLSIRLERALDEFNEWRELLALIEIEEREEFEWEELQ